MERSGASTGSARSSGSARSIEGVDESLGGALLHMQEGILDHLRDLVVVTDLDDRVVYANPAVEALCGVAPSDAIGSQVSSLVTLNWPTPTAEAEATELVASKGGWHGEILVSTPGMGERWFDLSISALPDPQGQVLAYATTGRDVTERRLVQSALNAAQARYRSLVEQAPGVTYMDGIAGGPRRIYVSPQIEGLLGITPEEWVAEGPDPWEALLHPDDRQRVLEAHARSNETWNEWDEEYRVVTRAGNVIHIHDTASVVRDEQGRPAYWQGTFTDVTARRIAEQDLAFQARILRQISDAVITTDCQRLITSWNAAAEAMYGWHADEVVGQPIWSVVRSECLEDAAVDAVFAYAEDGPIQGELIQYHRNGEAIYVEAKGMPLFDQDGEPAGYVTVNRNVTERKDAERAASAALVAEAAAARASSAKSEFLSRMSHELRTPLNAISGFAQLLAMEDLTGEQRHSTEQIMRGGEHLLNLINEILDVSRVEVDQLGLAAEPVSMREAILDATSLINALAERYDVDIDEDLEALEDWGVVADPQRLKQVLLNLLSNAVKYNGHGGWVRVSVAPGDGDTVRTTVTDDGPGVALDQRDRLFMPFERLGAESTDVEGTGLGLALCRRMVEAMDGVIGFETPPKGGLAMWFELPRADLPERGPAPRHLTSASSDAGFANHGLVLYVEDNLSNLRLFQQIISRRPGVELVYAMQGQLGFDLAMERHPDLILLDLHLPDVSGAELVRRFRSQPAWRDTPIFMVSADATAIQVEALMQAGADEYLTKPLDIARFLTILDRTLSSVSPTTASLSMRPESWAPGHVSRSPADRGVTEGAIRAKTEEVLR